MIIRLIAFILLYGALAVGGVLTTWRFVAKPLILPWWERRQRQLTGMRNAKRIEAHAEETCFICLKPTDYKHDLFNRRRGWFHAVCWKQLTEGDCP